MNSRVAGIFEYQDNPRLIQVCRRAFGVPNLATPNSRPLTPNFNGPRVRLVLSMARVLAVALFLGFIACQVDARVLVATNSPWRYFKGTQEASTPTNAWRALDFDDSTWATGAAPFHYGTNPVGGDDLVTDGTILADMRSNYTCIYLRHTFVIPDKIDISALRLTVWVDDGFAIWLNGETARPAFLVNGVAHTDVATAGREALSYLSRLDSAVPLLRHGTNVLCLQVFNVDRNDNDFRFDLQLAEPMPEVAFAVAEVRTRENAGEVAIDVIRSGTLGDETTVEWVTVDYTAKAGADYVGSGGLLTFEPGQTRQTIRIPLLNDGQPEPLEWFVVRLNTTAGVGPNQINIDIEDNDVGFLFFASTTPLVVAESAASVELVVIGPDERTEPASVEWLTQDATAKAGLDYVASWGVLTFAAGETAKIVQVPLLNDGLPEGSETFSVVLTRPSAGVGLGTPSLVTVQIRDNEKGLHFEKSSTVVSEANDAVELVIRREDDIPQAASVEWFTTNVTARAGEDYLESSGLVTFEVGETQKVIRIPILNDGRPEGLETFSVRLRNPTDLAGLGVYSQATVEILDTERGLYFETASTVVHEPSGWVEVAIRRDDDWPETVAVEWLTVGNSALAGEDYVGTNGVVQFETGETRKTVKVRILNDGRPEGPEWFLVALRNVTGQGGIGSPSQTVVMVQDNDRGFLSSLRLTPSTKPTALWTSSSFVRMISRIRGWSSGSPSTTPPATAVITWAALAKSRLHQERRRRPSASPS